MHHNHTPFLMLALGTHSSPRSQHPRHPSPPGSQELALRASPGSQHQALLLSQFPSTRHSLLPTPDSLAHKRRRTL